MKDCFFLDFRELHLTHREHACKKSTKKTTARLRQLTDVLGEWRFRYYRRATSTTTLLSTWDDSFLLDFGLINKHHTL